MPQLLPQFPCGRGTTTFSLCIEVTHTCPASCPLTWPTETPGSSRFSPYSSLHTSAKPFPFLARLRLPASLSLFKLCPLPGMPSHPLLVEGVSSLPDHTVCRTLQPVLLSARASLGNILLCPHQPVSHSCFKTLPRQFLLCGETSQPPSSLSLTWKEFVIPSLWQLLCLDYELALMCLYCHVAVGSVGAGPMSVYI